MLPASAMRKAANAGQVHSSSANVAPVTSMDSPSAIMTKRPQRSARWPPSVAQSVVSDRPSPGTKKPTAGPEYSMASATVHSPSLGPGAAKPKQRRDREPDNDTLKVLGVRAPP